jgi:hypothetical protein
LKEDEKNGKEEGVEYLYLPRSVDVVDDLYRSVRTPPPSDEKEEKYFILIIF